MPKLEFLTTATGLAKGDNEHEVQYCFPHLSTLVISDCSKLNVKPHFPLSLRELTLEGNNEQLLSSDSFLCPRPAHCDVSSPSSCIVDVHSTKTWRIDRIIIWLGVVAAPQWAS